MLSLLPVVTKYGATAVFGAATRTYFEYKRNNAPLCKVVGGFLLNSVFAILFSSIMIHAFLNELPGKSHFAYMIAYLSGAIGLNILSGLLSVNWGKAIQSRVDK